MKSYSQKSPWPQLSIIKNGGKYKSTEFKDTCVVNSFLHCLRWAYFKSPYFKNLTDKNEFPKVLRFVKSVDAASKKDRDNAERLRNELLWKLYKTRNVVNSCIHCNDSHINVIDVLFEAFPSIIQTITCQKHEKSQELIYSCITVTNNDYGFLNIEKAINSALKSTSNRRLDCCRCQENKFETKLDVQKVVWLDTSDIKWKLGSKITEQVKIAGGEFVCCAFINKEIDAKNHVVAYCREESGNEDWLVYDDSQNDTRRGRDLNYFNPLAILYIDECAYDENSDL